MLHAAVTRLDVAGQGKPKTTLAVARNARPEGHGSSKYQNSQSKGNMSKATRRRLEGVYHPYTKLLVRMLASHGMPFTPWGDRQPG